MKDRYKTGQFRSRKPHGDGFNSHASYREQRSNTRRNVLHVHDLVDNVTEESELAGRAAAGYIFGTYAPRKNPITVKPGNNIGYVVPQSIRYHDDSQKVIRLYMRVRNPQENVTMEIKDDKGEVLAKFKKDIVEPGSMVNLALPTMKLTDDISEITVSVAE